MHPKGKFSLILALAVGAGLEGCIPFPRHSLVQPQVRFVVQDESGHALSGANVFLRTVTQPHSVRGKAVAMTTGENGIALFQRERRWERTFPLMIHGVPFYSWEWCIEKPGFAAERGTINSDADEKLLDVRMVVRADKTGCREFVGYEDDK